MRERVAVVGALVVVWLAAAPGQAGAAVPHTVTEGETLWSIAAANGMSTASVAAFNGLSPEHQVVLGSTVMIPSQSEALGGQQAAPAAAPTTAPATSSGSGFASSEQVGSAAAQHGATPSVAKGIAYQESGFNNAMVSPVGAMGVMQVMPDTWDFVENNLGAGSLNPASTADNVKAGTMFLNYLQGQTGDLNTAIGAYYQGLGSVQQHGILPETQQYIDNVMAHANRFGG